MPLPSVRQAGAIPIRGGRVCLITSRTGRRWVIPKGWIESGKTPAITALSEAWEEAGVEGQLSSDPIGQYTYEKAGRSYLVTVFVLEVTQEHEDWPEADERTRDWVTLDEALTRIEEPELRDILREVLRGATAGK